MEVDVHATIYLALTIGAVGVVGLVYSIGCIFQNQWLKWQRQYLEEAEYELDEMLLAMPASQVLNYALGIAGVVAVGAFLVFSNMGRGFNWQIGLLFAVLAFVAVVFLSRFALRLLKARRLERFNEQLEEALMSMSNSLKAGFSISQAIDLVVKQNKQPISIEFKLMMQQVHLGMTLDQALMNMAERVQSEDFYLVASSISTARQTGGDLTGIFERLAIMIRERQRIQRRIRTLTAQGRLQGTVLGALPMLLLIILYLMDPTLVANFFTKPVGIALFLVVIVLEVCGFLVIRKVVSIDI